MMDWMNTLRGYYAQASTDGFVATLINSTSPRPVIISSSSTPLNAALGLHSRMAQQLTLTGSANTLITALGHAQIAFPAVTPIEWRLRRNSKSDALQMETRLIVPDLPPRSSPPAPSTFQDQLPVHEFNTPSLATTLGDQEIDAYGLPASGQRPPASPVNSSQESPAKNSLDLARIIHQLKLQGINAGGEAIINTYILHPGDRIKTRVGSESVELQIKEIHADSVLVGWDQSASTGSLQLPNLIDPVTLSSESPDVASPDEIILSPDTHEAPTPTQLSQFGTSASSSRLTPH
jgi:hypothetical protein